MKIEITLGKVMMIMIVTLIALFILTFIKENNWNNKYNKWAGECIEQGGIVMVNKRWIGARNHACIKDRVEILRID